MTRDQAAQSCFTYCDTTFNTGGLNPPFYFQTLSDIRCFCFQECGTPTPNTSDRWTYRASDPTPPPCEYSVTITSAISRRNAIKPGMKVKLTLRIANKGVTSVDNKLVVAVPEGFTYVSSSVLPRTKTTTRKPSKPVDGILYWEVLPTSAAGSKRSQLKIVITLRADKTALAGTYEIQSFLHQGLNDSPDCLEFAASEVRVQI